MKFAALFCATVSADFASESATNPKIKSVYRDTRVENTEKRYFQLKELMLHYNDKFDEKKMWNYGCHCLILGDRPMSDMGSGAPADDLDKVCQEYKNCQKCAREQHGETCIGEFIRYKMRIESGVEPKCNSKADTCERHLCECDKAFAQAHANKRGFFNNAYNRFNKNFDEDELGICQPGTSQGLNDPQCCNSLAGDKPFVMYNSNRQQCCDGHVQPISAGGCSYN